MFYHEGGNRCGHGGFVCCAETSTVLEISAGLLRQSTVLWTTVRPLKAQPPIMPDENWSERIFLDPSKIQQQSQEVLPEQTTTHCSRE